MAVDYNKLIYSNASATPQMDIYNAYKKGREATKAEDMKRFETARDTDLAKSNAQYDANATKNYINYRTAMKNAPSQLNALGIRGGASESSLIRLGTNYGTNVATNEAARASALDDLRKQYADQIYEYNKAYDEDLRAKEAAYREKQDQWEREQIAKNLEYFSQAIKGQYDSKKGYEDLIKQLEASNDPNKVAKIMLTRQAMNEWVAANKNANGGGGGGGSSRSYRSYGGGNSTTVNGGNSYADTTSNAKTMSNAEKRNYGAQQQSKNRNTGVTVTKANTKKKSGLVYGNSFTGGLYKY